MCPRTRGRGLLPPTQPQRLGVQSYPQRQHWSLRGRTRLGGGPHHALNASPSRQVPPPSLFLQTFHKRLTEVPPMPERSRLGAWGSGKGPRGKFLWNTHPPGPRAAAGWERRAAASRVLTGTAPAAPLWLSQALPSFIYSLSWTRQDGRTPAPQHPLHGPQTRAATSQTLSKVTGGAEGSKLLLRRHFSVERTACNLGVGFRRARSRHPPPAPPAGARWMGYQRMALGSWCPMASRVGRGPGATQLGLALRQPPPRSREGTTAI